MTRFSIQFWLVSHVSKERELVLGVTLWRDSINAAKHAVAKILKENADPRLGTLEAYPGARPPQKIKWHLWGGMTQHEGRGLPFNRIERKSKPITARLAPVQKYVEAVIIWHPLGKEKNHATPR